ncbi:MAG: hypothetical protein Ct9H300mP6_13330 [Gammaproteobacteria bacterium]|nr:MAG: hypothetical protein Ct9H300mP6_13330 [Gammaproteobacteria bacterium]
MLRFLIILKRWIKLVLKNPFLIAVRGPGILEFLRALKIPYESVHSVCQEFPQRFLGLAGVDPFRGKGRIKGSRSRSQGIWLCWGPHLYPHWCELPPDHRKYYPYYAKCCELDIPIMMQVGPNLIYSRNRRLPSVGRPIYLDQVAIDFPGLKLIGIHIGIPWTEEMISMCWKHENFILLAMLMRLSTGLKLLFIMPKIYTADTK